MLGTYAATLLVVGASLVVGQAALAVCGWRRWSWLSPAVGVALLLAVAWGTVRLPGEKATALVAIGVLTLAALALLWRRRRPEGLAEAIREGLPAAVLVLVGVSIPFVVEGHFGVLGTSFNPDMGQQLFGANWLADPDRHEPTLLENGYPLGPHALAAALSVLTGGNVVQAFTGVTIAVPILAALTSLVVLRDAGADPARASARPWPGLPYMVASYLAQGLFKELLMALFVLGFALCLHELARGEPAAEDRSRLLAPVPLGLIAIGAVYAYSAPGLVWLGGTAVLFAAIELNRVRVAGKDVGAAVRAAAAPVGVALAVLVLAVAPEIGRMVEFRGTAVDVAKAESPEDGRGRDAGRACRPRTKKSARRTRPRTGPQSPSRSSSTTSSETSSTRSPRSRRSASGRAGTSASSPGTARSRRRSSTSERCSAPLRSASASCAGGAAARPRCRRRSRPPSPSISRRASRALPTPRRRRS